MTAPTSPPESLKVTLFTIVFAVALFAWLAVDAASGDDEEAPESSAGAAAASETSPDRGPAGDGFGAEIACERFIERRSGLDYDFEDQDHVESGKRWAVTGMAVAPDSSLQPYRCVVQSDAAEESWTLHALRLIR